MNVHPAASSDPGLALDRTGVQNTECPVSNTGMGRLESVLKSGRFAVTAELAPPDSADPQDVFDRAAVFEGCVDAINATDGSGANVHMSSVAVSALLKARGQTPVMQISCRDRNRIAIQGDALGAAALGIENILCISGDGVQVGDHPGAKPVFDLGSISLLETLRKMRDEKQFLSGRPLTTSPRLFLGAAANPFMTPRDFRVRRLKLKVDAGAQFIQTQYCFDVDILRSFMADVCSQRLDERAYILVGIGPLASAKSARWIRSHVPGVHVSEEIVNRMERAEKPAEEGRRICVELIQQIREIPGIAGVHIMAARQERHVADIVRKSGVRVDSRAQSET